MNKVPERLLPGEGDWNFAGHQHLQRYEFATRFVGAGATLDWACGVGYGSYVLASASAGPVLGADIAEDALTYARSHYIRPNLTYIQADALNGPFEGRDFELVVSFETIEHLPDPVKFLQNVHASLRPGGRLLLSAPNALLHSRHPTRPIQNDFHVSEPTYEELVRWVEPGFVIQREWEQTPFVDFFAMDAGRDSAAANQAGNYAWCRWLNRVEDGVRSLVGRPLPRRNAGGSPWPKRWAEIVPLLPERRPHAHTFLLLCVKR